MKLPQNIKSIELLETNFIGFIFYTYSPRFIGVSFPIEQQIKKIGVIVNNSISNRLQTVQKYAIDFVQLYDQESLEFCEELYKNNVSIIKVFRVNEALAFFCIHKYINYSLFFLFDTYCIEYGGSGKKFSWNKISENAFDIPFFLSGGIGSEDVKRIKNGFHTKNLGIDLNSKFEIEPTNKNRDELRRFIHKIRL